MDQAAQLNAGVELLSRMGVDVRHEHLGGSGGGFCMLRGRQVVFVDLDADPSTQAEHCVQALAVLPQIDAMFVPPALRERIDSARAARKG